MVNRDALFIAGMGIMIAIAVVYSFVSYIDRPLATPQFNTASSSILSGDVAIEVELLTNTSNQLTFSVSLNTHLVDLSQFNLQELVTLEYNGKSFQPISAPKLSGHHASSNLVFEADEERDHFMIKIKGIPRNLNREFAFS